MPKKTTVPAEKPFCTLEDLYRDGTLPRPTAADKRRAKNRQRIEVHAGKKRGKWELSVTGKNLSLESLRILFEALHAATELCGDGDEWILATFPVVRELEDPKLMKLLDKRLAQVKKHLRAEVKAKKRG